MPAAALPADIARDPKSCLIAVTIELREHALAHAARVLRESGATPAQLKVGIQLALGKTKPVIAHTLGINLTTVASLASFCAAIPGSPLPRSKSGSAARSVRITHRSVMTLSTAQICLAERASRIDREAR
jgi:hypothetical protein